MRTKGGTHANFNCINLQLSADDLDRLETAIRDRTLPATEGFFFGVSDGSVLVCRPFSGYYAPIEAIWSTLLGRITAIYSTPIFECSTIKLSATVAVPLSN
ncbi:hypothetical protein [Sinorhizobium sojae]|uniref:hypothetical protein n=1 Tax=Sinorhizobium sojae TaxID=716925 RepID=UPI000559485D|nr:hypothetical protein [Sinorhizobium sojae]